MLFSPFESSRIIVVVFFDNVQWVFTNNTINLILISCFIYIFFCYIQLFSIKEFPLFKYIYKVDLFLDSLILNSLPTISYFFQFLLKYIFFFIFFNNVLGLLPWGFSSTSHITSTLEVSFFMWSLIVVAAFNYYGLLFLNIIKPNGIPSILVWFLIFIEFISYLFRFFSLALRLFANVLAGHILLHVIVAAISFFFFSSTIGFSFFNNSVLFITIIVYVLYAFELIVSFLQSYIFIVLSLIYLKDLSELTH